MSKTTLCKGVTSMSPVNIEKMYEKRHQNAFIVSFHWASFNGIKDVELTSLFLLSGACVCVCVTTLGDK